MANVPIDPLETSDIPPGPPKADGRGLSENEAFGSDLNPVKETPNAAKNLKAGPGGVGG